MEINERLRQLDSIEQEKKGSLPAKLKSFVAQSTVRTLLTSKHRPSFEVNAAIFAAYPNLNPGWYFFGEGEMFYHESSTKNDLSVKAQATNVKLNDSYDIQSLARMIVEIHENVELIQRHLSKIDRKDLV